jgi:hypothetical protein
MDDDNLKALAIGANAMKSLRKLFTMSLLVAIFGCTRTPNPPTKNGLIENKVSPTPKVTKEPKKGIDPNDPSVVYDEPYVMNTGFKIYNGKAYDKCSLCVAAARTLVLPDKSTLVEQNGKVDVVSIYIEKDVHASSHGDVSFDMVTINRHKMGCAVKVQKERMLIGTFGQWGDRHSYRNMRLVVVAPTKMKVTRGEGLIGEPEERKGPDAFSGGLGSPLKKTKAELPNCYLLPASDDEWHEIPAIADVERRASKDKTPDAKDDR